jgi:hypothetical protein
VPEGALAAGRSIFWPVRKQKLALAVLGVKENWALRPSVGSKLAMVVPGATKTQEPKARPQMGYERLKEGRARRARAVAAVAQEAHVPRSGAEEVPRPGGRMPGALGR